MNPTPENTILTPTKSTKKSAPWPIIGAVAGAGLLAFTLGRATSPGDPPVNMGTNQTPGTGAQSGLAADEHAEGEAGHEEHAGHKEGEAGHAAGESGHSEAEGAHKEGEAAHEEHGAEEIKFDAATAKDAGIVVQTISASPLVSGLPVTGSIEASPNRVVRVASVVPGRVVRLNANIGQRVSKGQVLAILESRSIGEAQSAFQQATARLQNASSNLRVVQAQAKAGVFSRAPLETARGRLIDAQADVRAQENAVRSARIALENAQRLVRAGSFASPAIEAARRERAQADEGLKVARAALSSATSSVTSTRSELARRREIAAGGGYASRPVQEAQRLLTASQSAQNAAQSEVATTRANLARAKSLASEGLVSNRDLENAQNAFDTATARLETARADARAAQSELTRQTRLGTSNVASNAEIAEASRALSAAQSDVRIRRAEVERAEEGVRLASRALTRESSVFRSGVANRREIVGVQTALSSAQTALIRARATLGVAQSGFRREEGIYRANLNNNAQIQAARSQFVAAQSELGAARTALGLLKSSPNGSASVPIRAPISGIITEREIAPGEVLDADARLMTIADNSIVHADFNVAERDISKIRLGAPVEMRADAVPGSVYRGPIELIHTQLDPKTRTVETHAEVANPGGLLRFGMAIRGTIQVGAQNRLAMQVPAAAVQDMEGKKVVFLAADEANTYVAREVEVGATVGGKTTISSGLKNGDKIVVKGGFMVKAQAMKAELGHDH